LFAERHGISDEELTKMSDVVDAAEGQVRQSAEVLLNQ
jgi:hypothetical protein